MTKVSDYMREGEALEKIVKQNEFIISLLGRMAFRQDELKKLVIKGSKKPAAIIKAYNMCNGTRTITEIANHVGITPSAMTQAVDRWEKNGIIFKAKKGNEVLPLKVRTIT